MSDLYEDVGKRIIHKDLFDERAKTYATSIKKVSPTQIRRIYDELKRLKRKVEKIKNEEGNNSEQEFRKLLPYLFMEKSKIAYTIARAKKNKRREDAESYDNLKKIIDIFITKQNIQTKEDYIVFCDLMEAILGFHYGEASEK